MTPFIKKCNKIGLITMGIALIANFLPCMYMWAVYGVIPSGSQLLGIWAIAAGAYGVSWLTQAITFYTSLGAAGTYISNLAGSNSDIRLPAANMALKICGVEAGTEKGEAISTMAVASTVFVSFTLVTLFTFIGTSIIPLFPPFVTTAFSYVLPALFGAIYTDLSKKDMATGGLTIAACLLLFVVYPSGLNSSFKSLFTVILGGVCARVVYVKMKKKAEDMSKKAEHEKK